MRVERLVANLESPLPGSLPPGCRTAVFCYGTCFHPREAVVDLELVIDGIRHRPAATQMPRPDIFAALHPDGLASAEDPELRCLRSGFWGTVPVTVPAGADAVEIALAARTASGDEEVVPIGRIPVAARARPPALGHRAEPGLIAICMATFEPEPALFEGQIDSLRGQTDEHWVCAISDDCSGPAHVARIEAAVAGDPRFTISRSTRRLGFYRNFERALGLAPAEAELLALCDQDDRWHPDKLGTLRAALGEAVLVYSDQRLVDADGRVLRDTLWRGRRNNHTDLASLLVANSITGAATLFRREVAELAVPFPDTPGLQFHDHWLGLVALAAGDMAYVDGALYDYTQHRGAVFGDVTRGRGRRIPRPAWPLLRGGRGAYFLGYLAREVQAEVLLARCGSRLTPRKRRVLRRYVAAGRSPAAFAWLAARSLRVLAGRNETLGSESELARGIAWRWLVALLSRAGGREPGRLPLDAGFPDPLSFEQKRLRRWRARA